MNVGSANWNATWLQFDDGTDKSWDGTNGTCSKSGYSPRSICQAQNKCSISGYNNQSSCTSAGTCSLSGYSTQSNCTSAGTCSNPGQTSPERLYRPPGLHEPELFEQKPVPEQRRRWGLVRGRPAAWTAGVWSPATWTPANRNTWNGCVTDRGLAAGAGTAAGNDQRIVTPSTGDASTLFYP